MKCEIFKKSYLGHSKISTEIFSQCLEHVRECVSCQDYMTSIDLKNEGINLSRYPCVHMAKYATFSCEQHSDLNECHDALVLYEPRFDQYSINNPAPAVTPIRFCPWCGTDLPDKTELWFNKLEELGYDDPFSQDIPIKFNSDKWYVKT